jgi:geranylgeranyl pyrophosphate synthase
MTDTLVNQITKKWRGRIECELDAVFPADRNHHLNCAIRYHLATGGKRIRPVLALLTCEQLGGDPERALPFAVSAEILHNMFLLHDDIEDGDRVRRDKATVWVEYGVGNAVNCGDYMLARAYRVLIDAYARTPLGAPLIDLFTFVLERTIEGQALDINTRGSENLTVDEYLNMVELKTGHYLGFTMTGGAIIAQATQEVRDRLARVGRLLGPAFQIRDDIIDLTEGKGRGGEIGCDIREGKPSMLLAAALPHCNAGEKAELVGILRKPREQTTEEDVRRAIGIFKKYNAIGFAQKFADDLVAQALRIVDQIPFKEPETFRSFARFISARKR